MKLSLITIGKTDIAWVKQGLEVYTSRLSHYIPFELVEIPELRSTRCLSNEQIKNKEAEGLLKLIKPNDFLILLDERGKQYRSIEFAKYLEDTMLRMQRKDIVFVIGGAYGFSQSVYQRANSLLSLSSMTFSHQIIRTIFAEQLYRAFTIIKGESYHHE